MSNDSPLKLRQELAQFSRRLDSRVREFQKDGEFSDVHGRLLDKLRDRQRRVEEKLKTAEQNGSTSDVLRIELERDFQGLSDELLLFEERLDAEQMKRQNGSLP